MNELTLGWPRVPLFASLLIPNVTHILQNVFSRLHVCDARKLDMLAELRIGPSQIRAGHSDKVTKELGVLEAQLELGRVPAAGIVVRRMLAKHHDVIIRKAGKYCVHRASRVALSRGV